MAKFFYVALKNNKTEVKGYVEAQDSREARDKIRGLGFLPTNIYEETFEKPKVEKTSPKVTSLSLSEKIFFTSELQVMLASSISVIEALDTVEEHAHKPKIKIIAQDLKEKIMSGMTFSDAIQSYESVFGTVYTGLCIAGEESGQLDKTLEYMLVVLRKEDDLKSKVISMSVYPAIVVVILVAVFLLCGKLIFPAFISGANVSPNDIPLTVKFVTMSCDMIFHYWVIFLGMLVAGGYGLSVIWKQSSVKRKFDETLLKIPLVKDFVRYVNLASFFTVMNVAYEAGLTIMSSLTLSGSTITNTKIKTEADNVEKLVNSGQTLSQSFVRAEFLPPVFNTLIATGEKSGRLGQMFRDIAIAIDKKLELVTQALSKAFEPALTVIIGIVVGYIVIAFFQLYGSVIQSLI